MKLPKDIIEKFKSSQIEFFGKLISIANLKLKISEQEACGVISVLLSSVFSKETSLCPAIILPLLILWLIV